MSVENMPIFGGSVASTDSDREASTTVTQRPAAVTSLNEFRRQVMALELVILLVAAGVAALVVNQTSTGAHPLAVAFGFTAIWAVCLSVSNSFRLPGIEIAEGGMASARHTRCASLLTGSLQ